VGDTPAHGRCNYQRLTVLVCACCRAEGYRLW
jgi:hypothetical protein